jgi:hypothetical protein
MGEFAWAYFEPAGYLRRRKFLRGGYPQCLACIFTGPWINPSNIADLDLKYGFRVVFFG